MIELLSEIDTPEAQLELNGDLDPGVLRPLDEKQGVGNQYLPASSCPCACERLLVRNLHTSDFRNLHEVAVQAASARKRHLRRQRAGQTNLLERSIFLLATSVRFVAAGSMTWCASYEKPGRRQHLSRRSRKATLGYGSDPDKAQSKSCAVRRKVSADSDYFQGVHVVLFAPGRSCCCPKDLRGTTTVSGSRNLEHLSGLSDEVRTTRAGAQEPQRGAQEHACSVGTEAKTKSGFGVEGELATEPSSDDSESLLSVYSEQLAMAGARLIDRRRYYLRTVRRRWKRRLTESVAADCAPASNIVPKVSSRDVEVASHSELQSILFDQLERDRKRDRIRGLPTADRTATTWSLGSTDERRIAYTPAKVRFARSCWR